MNWFMNLKIGKKLGLGFGLIEIMMMSIGVFVIAELGTVNNGIVEISTKWLPSIRALSELRFDAATVRRDTLSFILSTGDKKIQYEEKIKNDFDQVTSDDRAFEPLISSEEERKIYQQFVEQWGKYTEANAQVRALAKDAKNSEAVQLAQAVAGPLFDASAKALEEGIVLNDKGAADAAKQAAATYSSSRFWVIGMMISAVVLGLIGALGLARSIANSATKMLAMIQELAANNLAIDDMEISAQDEVGQACTALNSMKNNLHRVIQSMSETAQHVAAASEHLSSTSQHISANSEETSVQAGLVSQAAAQVNTNLQSVSIGGEEMTTTIQSIASNAHEAATIASNAVQTAQAANATVQKLGDSSAEVGEVIKVITSIAQQTNLLALNATIEAARAGEAGKGFAVVANEVKELAKQTAKATEDISRKINAIQSDAKGAVEAIASIGEVIGQINDISGTIATAVEEQSATTNEMTRNVADAAKGSGEITRNIAGVAEAARGTSTNAQESQKAADELAEMAAQLRGLVGKFKISSTPATLASSALIAKARAARASA